MPTTAIRQVLDGTSTTLKFDARPDRIDLRDRPYQPPLRNLPAQFPSAAFIVDHLHEYTALGLVLNQGREGACTGFGLAAVVNYLLWRRSKTEADAGPPQPSHPSPRAATSKKSSPVPAAPADPSPAATVVSARMLYELARRYDEWPGENYSGSSCRGAMKGWHRHGVCTQNIWPYTNDAGAIAFVPPRDGWQDDAAQRPLGAYYRVDKDSAVDMQSAILEVGAIYVSAQVHSGWSNLADSELGPGTLIGHKKKGESTGGHAFAFVGYTRQGFILQNSWGTHWGNSGFAILPYADWFEHAMDAWVAVMGAPMSAASPSTKPTGKSVRARVPALPPVRTRTQFNLQERASGMGAYNWSPTTTANQPIISPPPLTDDRAYEHTLVMGNNGEVINQFIDREDGPAAVHEVAHVLPKLWFTADPRAKRSATGRPTLAIYAHGGLNNEQASISRIRSLTPYFMEAGVYPLFLTWRTGVLESIIGALEDSVHELLGLPTAAEGLLDKAREALEEARDRTVEVVARNLGVRAVWSEMKQNAAAASAPGAGTALLAENIKSLVDTLGPIDLHLVGHSAGAILHGHVLTELNSAGIGVRSCRLFAPACSVRFAAAHYLPALALGAKSGLGKLHIDNLSDRVERADIVGSSAIYGKSLLYLVSRALEDTHKTPLLGLQAAWSDPRNADDLWNTALAPQLALDIRALRAAGVEPRTQDTSTAPTAPDKSITRNHGSFDNDTATIRDAIKSAGGTLTDAHAPNQMDLRGF